MRKRGVSQLDWIMSLALFLLYIGWFFVFVAPSISFNSNKDAVMILLEKKFEDEFTWQLKRFPLFIESNETGQLKPILMDYTYNSTQIKFIDGMDFIFWEDKMIFLANLTSGT